MGNILYRPPPIKKKRYEGLILQRSVEIPFLPEQFFYDKREGLLCRGEKRVRLGSFGVIDKYRGPKSSWREGSYHKGVLAAFTDKGPVLIRNNSFYSLPKEDITDGKLQVCEGGILLFDKERGRLLSYPVDFSYPLERKSKTWIREREKVVEFIPGKGSALFLQQKGYLLSFSFIGSANRIKEIGGYLDPRTLHAESEDGLYLCSGNSLQFIDLLSGIHQEIDTLEEMPREMIAWDGYLALLFSDVLQIRKQGKVVFQKEKVNHVQDIAHFANNLWLLFEKECKINAYKFYD